jgi:hypothetical protein
MIALQRRAITEPQDLPISTSKYTPSTREAQGISRILHLMTQAQGVGCYEDTPQGMGASRPGEVYLSGSLPHTDCAWSMRDTVATAAHRGG